MYRVLSFFAALILCVSSAFAGSIDGRVVDADGQPLPYVNVIVSQNQKTVKGTVSDDSGSFVVSGLHDGNFVVTLQFMGYQSVSHDVSLSDANNHHVSLPVSTLIEESRQVDEVAVVAQKQTMKLDIDKKVFNVSQDIASTGGSASDVLENIPSVEVDAEGNVSLRGSSSVTIWINGKAQGMTSDNRGDILQQLPSESIDHIEVITNPSSKYSPEGSAGIINIVLKRDRKAGYYGGVQVAVNSNKGGRAGANINFSSGILDAYANVGYGRRVHKNGGWTNRDYLQADSATGFLNSRYNGKNTGNHLFFRAGLTWHVSAKDEISLDYMGMRGSGDRKSNYTYLSLNYAPFSLINEFWRTRVSKNDDDMKMNNLDLGYRHEWKTGHTLEASVSKSGWTMDGNTYYDQNTYFFADIPFVISSLGFSPSAAQQPALDSVAVPAYQSQKSRIRNKEVEARLDYVQPLGDNSKIEAGYQGTFSRENSPTETFADEQRTLSIESLFNRFKYDNDINAAYLNWSSRIAQFFGYQVGLRGEWWTVHTSSFSYDQEYNGQQPDKFSKSYFELFPTAYLSFQLSESQEIQLNYTRRLSRPWGGQMNSFKNISDSTSISFGNPLLTPEFTNSFELNYIKNWDNHTLSISAYYRPSHDVIQQISYLDNGVRYSTNENVANSLSSGLEVIGKNRLWNVLDLTSTLNVFYYNLDGGTFYVSTDDGNSVPVVVSDDHDFSWNLREMVSVMLPKSITYQATFSYQAPTVITQGKRKASYNLDMGLKKTFLDRKFSLALNCRDLLDSRSTRTSTHASGFRQESYAWRGGRRFFLQFAWNFGNMKGDKDKQRQSVQTNGYDNGGADD